MHTSRSKLVVIATVLFLSLTVCAFHADGQTSILKGSLKNAPPPKQITVSLSHRSSLKQAHVGRWRMGRHNILGPLETSSTPKDRELAQQALQRGFLVGRSSSRARIQEARTLFSAGNNTKAKAECQAALAVAPRLNGAVHAPDAKQLLGEIYYTEGNYKQALYWFGDRAKNTKDDRQDFDIALCYVRLGDFQTARRHYSHDLVYRNSSSTTAADLPVIRDLKSLEASILLARGLDHDMTGQMKEASADYDAAARLAPDNAWLQHRRGWIAIRAGRKEEGLGLLRRASVSNNPRIQGDARRWLGDKEVDAIQKAQRIAK
jgi:tetratricopeptide (TPR) repeat protein